jgi:hypothetical protein
MTSVFSSTSRWIAVRLRTSVETSRGELAIAQIVNSVLYSSSVCFGQRSPGLAVTSQLSIRIAVQRNQRSVAMSFYTDKREKWLEQITSASFEKIACVPPSGASEGRDTFEV